MSDGTDQDAVLEMLNNIGRNRVHSHVIDYVAEKTGHTLSEVRRFARAAGYEVNDDRETDGTGSGSVLETWLSGLGPSFHISEDQPLPDKREDVIDVHATVAIRERITRRREWVIEGPDVQVKDLMIVIGWAEQALPEDQRGYDDSVSIRGGGADGDGSVIVSITVETTVAAK
jgi:hypothetical protein